jgi:Raf kinase inhibitor-like YbhB/YbcL family protein
MADSHGDPSGAPVMKFVQRAMIVFLAAVPGLMSCGDERKSAPEATPAATATMRLLSRSFVEGATIPKVHTCDGADTSPPLNWPGVPETARSLALIVEDPDAPGGTFTHWVLFNLPPDLKELGEAIAADREVSIAPAGAKARQGTNDFDKVGYGGPCPPSGTHRYYFILYALDNRPDLEPGATRLELLQAIKGHIIAEGRLMGRYSRSRPEAPGG